MLPLHQILMMMMILLNVVAIKLDSVYGLLFFPLRNQLL